MLVHRGNRIVSGKLLPQGINQASALVSSLDAHVTWGGLCYRILGNKTKGEDCVKCHYSVLFLRVTKLPKPGLSVNFLLSSHGDQSFFCQVRFICCLCSETQTLITVLGLRCLQLENRPWVYSSSPPLSHWYK